MRYTAGDGVTYAVTFVHSAHDIKHTLPGAPGGLRQIVDGLAKSLRRRVTLCEIARLDQTETLDPLTTDFIPTFTTVPLSYGFSVCHYFDQFVKAQGRARAFERALRASKLDNFIRAELDSALRLGV
jgi:hypothetical protein